MNQRSLADEAVQALAAVAAIDVHNDNPARHQARTLKRIAERTLAEAFMAAQDLAYAANTITQETKNHE